MSSAHSIWATLGIEPTDDEALIRRAYATKLRKTRPEDDPDGFQRLRAAYEYALARATRIVTRQPSPSFDEGARAPSPVRNEPAQWVAPAVRESEPQAPEPPPVDELEQALGALVERLARSTDVSKNLRAALRTFAAALRNAAFGAVARAEGELAGRLLAFGPGETERLDIVVEELGWAQRAERGEASPTIAMVVARARDFALLRRFETRSDDYAGAFRLLSEPPKPFRMRWALFWSLRLEAITIEFFHRLHDEFPIALAQMNRESIEWWRRYIEEPRIRALMQQTWAAFPLLGAFIAMLWVSDRPSPDPGLLYAAGVGMAAGFLFVGVIALGKLWLVDWPRHLIARRALSFRAVTRIDGLWLVVTLGLPLAAVFLPESLGSRIAVGGVGVVAVLWVVLTSRSVGGQGGFIPFALAMAMMNGVLTLVWVTALDGWPLSNARTVGIAVASAIIAHAIGTQRLAHWWNVRLSDAERSAGKWALLAAGAAVIAAAFFGPRGPTLGPAWLAAATAVVLLHRVPVNVTLGNDWFYVRGAAAFGAFVIGAVAFESYVERDDPWLGAMTAALGCGVVASFALLAVKRAQDWLASRRARARW